MVWQVGQTGRWPPRSPAISVIAKITMKM